jgi:pyruvate-formate lyase-activating enzyme
VDPAFVARLSSYHALQDAFVRRVESARPLIVEIEPTTHCAFGCLFCPRERLTREKGSLAPEDFSRILNNLGDPFAGSMLVLSGLGEPLAHAGAASLVKQAKRAGWACGLTTNGALLTEERVVELVEGGLDVLQVSLHAVSELTWQRLVGGGSLAEIVASIRAAIPLCRDRVVLALNYTLTPLNHAETSAFASFWQREGVDCINFSPCHNRGGLLQDGSLFRTGGAAEAAGPCWVRRHALFVTWQGKVLSCCNDFTGETCRGDLVREPLADILRSGARLEEREAGAPCARCDFPLRFAARRPAGR